MLNVTKRLANLFITLFYINTKGFEVQGMFMRNWEEASGNGVCTGDKEAEYASYICSKLGIPFKEVNFVREYWLEVFRFSGIFL